jgi:hypothetical protein
MAEFRELSVKLANQMDKSVAQTTRDLGVKEYTASVTS